MIEYISSIKVFDEERDIFMNRIYTESPHSHFDGGLLGYIGWVIFGAIITVFTLRLATPWAIVNMYRWEIEHTVIDGKRLAFSGTGWGLFGQWIKWWFLSIITLGIYGFWVHIKLLDWKARHTSLVTEFYDF